jgi:hypothetical protein
MSATVHNPTVSVLGPKKIGSEHAIVSWRELLAVVELAPSRV